MKVTDVKVIAITEDNGVTKDGGTWNSKTLVVEDDSREYGESTAITYMNDKANALMGIQVGDHVETSFALRARKYTDRNGKERYSTEARGYGEVKKMR